MSISEIYLLLLHLPAPRVPPNCFLRLHRGPSIHFPLSQLFHVEDGNESVNECVDTANGCCAFEPDKDNDWLHIELRGDERGRERFLVAARIRENHGCCCVRGLMLCFDAIRDMRQEPDENVDHGMA